MHQLQALITDGNDPKDIEYIVTYDIPELGLSIKSSPVPKGTVVNNVKRNIVEGHHHGYEFIIKETGEKHITMYAWALAENTIENKVELELYWAMQKNVKDYQRLVVKQHKRVKTLEVQ